MTKTLDPPALRAERGLMLLENSFPGATDGINLVRLNIRTPLDCVLGQWVGFYTGCERLGLDDDEVSYYGFDVAMTLSWPDAVADYRALTEAWVRAIEGHRARKEQEGPVTS